MAFTRVRGVGIVTNANMHDINSTGVITATRFDGDGSQLTGVSGFATALSPDASKVENLFHKTPEIHTTGAGVTVYIKSDNICGNIAFTRLNTLVVSTGSTFQVGAGTTLIFDVLNIFP